ncbi:hypothetical protein, partial [Thiohalocapsa sp.]|uniref:SMP-30/gluconolactonase/LRE family protein n=1 Tax=Thiohalocapsa sp. TaxID=2497641 RepID=UPI0025FA4BA0
MQTYQARVVADGLAFPEGPRWHDGRFWFTDQHAHKVLAMAADGSLEPIATAEDRPGGLGWLPNGGLVCVLMPMRRIGRIVDGALLTYVDLTQHAPLLCTELVG